MKGRESPIVVLSTGRSGSTVLQKLMNTHPDVTIWGEHAGFLSGLSAAWHEVKKSEWIPQHEARGKWLLESPRPLNPDKWTAWDGSFSKDDFKRRLREFSDNLFCQQIPEEKRWGFKEIRYRSIDFVEFFLDLYPSAQFLLLMRNPIDSCVSFVSAFAPKAGSTETEYRISASRVAEQQIKPVVTLFRAMLERFPGMVKMVFFEDLVKFPHNSMRELESFLELGASFPENGIDIIINKDIVSQRKIMNEDIRGMLTEICGSLLSDEASWYFDIREILEN